MDCIKFEVSNTYLLPEKVNIRKMDEIEIIQYDLPFKIIINDYIFFYDEYFTVLEFIKTVLDWKEDNVCNDMLYNCIDTDDNPLISFRNTDYGWVIESPWERYKCDCYFDKKQILDAFEELLMICNILK